MQNSLLILLTLLFGMAACSSGPPKKPIDYSLFDLHTIESHGHTLHYAQSGKANRTPLVFIHGTPGTWESYGNLMENTQLQNNFTMYSIDRLGWGKSVSKNNKFEAEFEPHTTAIRALLKKIHGQNNKKAIVIGHSLGGSLAPMVAITSPEYIKGLMVIAGDLDPKFGDPRWYNSAADLSLIKWLLPKKLVKANDEIMPLKQELLIMSKQLKEIKIPTSIIHGTKDELVSYENVAFAKKAFAHLGDKLDVVSVDKAGHFLIWEHIPTIVNAIEKLDKAE